MGLRYNQLLNGCFDFGNFVYSPRDGAAQILTANSGVGESHTLSVLLA